MKKILVIENEGIIRLSLRHLLNANGFDTIEAENGFVGLRLVREFVPDLILCNIKMPGLNGYEVFRELRRNSSTAAIPFIFLTAQIDINEFSQEEQRTIRYLDKPFIADELLEIIAEFLGSES